jgi:ubiquinone/menaquinone biosynthesis C-methylase UbiE
LGGSATGDCDAGVERDSNMNNQIRNYYESYDEEGRLFRDKAHLPEWLTTIRYFDRLFKPRSTILDACAGTGRYAFYLANKKHIVTACDLVKHNVDIIKSKPDAEKLFDIALCDVLDLSQFESDNFDAVLCMGALYHLRSTEQRTQAITECIRVCKPGGIVALTYITKIGAVLASLNEDVSNIDGLSAILNDSDGGIFFCAYPCDIERIAIYCGLQRQ